MVDPIVLIFLIGGITSFTRLPVDLPKTISKFASNFLLLAIGLKGGLELSTINFDSFITQSFFVMLLGVTLPLIAFPILKYIGKFDRKNSASIAAHYGSVSVGTFAVGIAYLQNLNINFETYTSVFVAILEIPAIIIGILLARKFNIASIKNKNFIKKIFFDKSIILIILGLILGAVVGGENITPIYKEFLILFKFILAIFLFDMGRVAFKELSFIKDKGIFLLSFGVFTPIIFSFIGGALGYFIGLSSGGATILAILAASASYIAVPAAMKVSVPEASPSISLTASLGITFPFNVIMGIPLYYRFVTQLIY